MRHVDMTRRKRPAADLPAGIYVEELSSGDEEYNSAAEDNLHDGDASHSGPVAIQLSISAEGVVALNLQHVTSGMPEQSNFTEHIPESEVVLPLAEMRAVDHSGGAKRMRLRSSGPLPPEERGDRRRGAIVAASRSAEGG